MVINYEIAMATFNGQEFLDEQIESLISQSVKPQRIIIFDDHSSDNTWDILTYWRNTSLIPIILLPRHSHRLGCVNAFERALLMTNEPYIMPSDQDDIWDVNKAEIMLTKLLSAESIYGERTPLLVYSDLRLIDTNNNLLSHSFYFTQALNPYRNHWSDIGMQNVVVGCACMFNRASLNCSLPFSSNTLVHDWWLALEISKVGRLIYLDAQTVSYRQHRKNLVGAKGFKYHLICKVSTWFKSIFGLTNEYTILSSVEVGINQFLASFQRIPQTCIVFLIALLLSSNIYERFLVALDIASKHGIIRTILWI